MRRRQGARLRREALSALVGLVAVVLAAQLLETASARPPSTAAPVDANAAAGAQALRAVDEVVPVASYTLHAALDVDTHTIAGEGTILFVNASQKPLDHLFVHLYLNAFEHERTVFRREHSGGFRGNQSSGEPGSIAVKRFHWREENRDIWPSGAHSPSDPDDRTDIEVPLPRPLAVGERATIDVVFESKLPSVVLRTGFAGSFHMAGQWFPKIAKLEPDGTFAHFPFQRFSEFYSNFGDYDVTIDVPEAFVVGATGQLESEHQADGRRVLRYVQRAVHDFGFTAWNGFDERTTEVGSVTLRCLFPRGQDRAARIEMEAAQRGLAFYGERFGAYPYATLTIVHPPDDAAEAGGMEYPTLITTGGSYSQSFAPGRLLEGLTLHELAHQWFYGLVASNENSSPFLDEGLTTYATGEALRALYGVDGLVDVAPFPIDLAAVERANQVGYFSHEQVAAPAGMFATGADYAVLVYARTATILRTLDAAFDGVAGLAIADYARTHRFAHPTADDLIAAFAARGGELPANALRKALFGNGWFDAEPLALWSTATADGAGYVGEVVIGRHGDIALPVVVEMTDTDGNAYRESLPAGLTTLKVAYRGAKPLAYVVVDPDGGLLLDEDKRNDALGNQPSNVAWRTWLVSAALGAAFFHLASP